MQGLASPRACGTLGPSSAWTRACNLHFTRGRMLQVNHDPSNRAQALLVPQIRVDTGTGPPMDPGQHASRHQGSASVLVTS